MSIRNQLTLFKTRLSGRLSTTKLPANSCALVQTYHPARHPFVREAVRIIQSCGFKRIILCNNNPDAPFEPDKDSRLEVINQTRHSLPITRLQIAEATDCEWFMALDDDILLRANQIARLVWENTRTPDSLVGIEGSVASRNRLFHGVTGQSVHTVHCGYFFNKQVIKRFWQLQSIIAETPRLAKVYYPYSDDVVLSFCGPNWPRAISVGDYLVHPTSNAQSVAVCRSENFHLRRSELFLALTDYLGWKLSGVQQPVNPLPVCQTRLSLAIP